jgi:hypothetical protein
LKFAFQSEFYLFWWFLDHPTIYLLLLKNPPKSNLYCEFENGFKNPILLPTIIRFKQIYTESFAVSKGFIFKIFCLMKFYSSPVLKLPWKCFKIHSIPSKLFHSAFNSTD